MTSMKTGFIALVVVIAACGGTAAPTTTSGGISLAPESTTTPSEEEPTTTAAASDEQPTTTIALSDVTPALGVTVAAGDSFDDDHLVRGAGSNFVSMDDPVMVRAQDVTWLDDDTVVMGLVHTSGETHAYPVGQMAYHHIANTTIAGEPFLVTY